MISGERRIVPKSSKHCPQSCPRGVAPQRDQFSGFLSWIEAKPRKRGKHSHGIAVPVLADGGMEKPIKLGRVRARFTLTMAACKLAWLPKLLAA